MLENRIINLVKFFDYGLRIRDVSMFILDLIQ